MIEKVRKPQKIRKQKSKFKKGRKEKYNGRHEDAAYKLIDFDCMLHITTLKSSSLSVCYDD